MYYELKRPIFRLQCKAVRMRTALHCTRATRLLLQLRVPSVSDPGAPGGVSEGKNGPVPATYVLLWRVHIVPQGVSIVYRAIRIRPPSSLAVRDRISFLLRELIYKESSIQYYNRIPAEHSSGWCHGCGGITLPWTIDDRSCHHCHAQATAMRGIGQNALP